MTDDGRLVPSPEFLTIDRDAAKKSLQKLAEYDVEAVICYHGGLYREEVNRRIGRFV